ncbi:MAG: gluconokinase [Deltaproteobacteria bacterium]|nr:gluconokinase [Deltaproteobacteria bacterium]
MIIILMGVSGSGKTTIGQHLAQSLGWTFYDGDDFHPQTNIDKMQQGIPLTDDDRDSWLSALQQLIARLLQNDRSAVLACSALKQIYRSRLQQHPKQVRFVYLKGDYALIRQRLMARQGHFMRADLLGSQFAALEEPHEVLTVDISQSPESIVTVITSAFLLS